MQEVNCCRFYTLINRKTWPRTARGLLCGRREVGPPVSLDGFPWAPSLSVLWCFRRNGVSVLSFNLSTEGGSVAAPHIKNSSLALIAN